MLSKYCRRCCLLPPKPALWATMESSPSISKRRFVISSKLLSTFETKLDLEPVKRSVSNYVVRFSSTCDVFYIQLVQLQYFKIKKIKKIIVVICLANGLGVH